MIRLLPLSSEFAIYQTDDAAKLPQSVTQADFYSFTRTAHEISVVSSFVGEFEGVLCDKTWRGFVVEGILDFALVGILHDITQPLKLHGISVFVISTYNTDYVFVKKENFDKAAEIFRNLENIVLVE